MVKNEALVNFAHASYRKVRDVSVTLMRMAYGRAPDKLYFVGSSEGGREGRAKRQAAVRGPALTPLCSWPLVPRYQGGDTASAASFACRP